MSSKYQLLQNRGFRCDFNPNRSLGLAWILFFRRKDYSYRLFQTLLLCSWRVSPEGVHMSGIWHMPKNPPRRGERFPLMWGFIPHGRGRFWAWKWCFPDQKSQHARLEVQTERMMDFNSLWKPSEARAIRCDAHFKSLQMSDEPTFCPFFFLIFKK